MLIVKQSGRTIKLNIKPENKLRNVRLIFFVYPLIETLSSNNLTINPYDEYIEDASLGKKSAYKKIVNPAENIFAICVVGIIASIFYVLNLSALSSVEAIASLIGSYIVAKELWRDLDVFLQSLTSNFIVSWRPEEYEFVREDLGTIQRFIEYSRESRYKVKAVLPKRFDYSQQSNSKMVELFYPELPSEQTQLLQVQSQANTLKLNDLVVGFKLSQSKQFLFFSYNQEQFQLIKQGKTGIIEGQNVFVKEACLVKNTFNIGRLKFYLGSKILKKSIVVTG